MVCAPKMTCWLLICALMSPDGIEKPAKYLVARTTTAEPEGAMATKVVRHLHAWDVEVGAQRLLIVGGQPPLLDVADHADDLRQLSESVDVDALADGILMGKIFLGKDFIDHDDERGVLVVLGVKKRPRQQRNSHRLQVVRFDDVVDGPVHVVFVRRFWLALKPKELFVVAAQGNRSPRLRNRLDTGDWRRACRQTRERQRGSHPDLRSSSTAEAKARR